MYDTCFVGARRSPSCAGLLCISRRSANYEGHLLRLLPTRLPSVSPESRPTNDCL